MNSVFKTIVFWLVIVLSGVLLWQVVRAGRAKASSPATKTTSPVSESRPSVSVERAVRSALDVQVAAWNRGDLDGFMQGYWHSPQLTFYSAGNVEQGWDGTLARYKRVYQGEGHEMGKLEFINLTVHSAGANDAWVEGRWHLKMSDGKDLGGLFTLIVKKFPEGWRIIHDHTSRDGTSPNRRDYFSLLCSSR